MINPDNIPIEVAINIQQILLSCIENKNILLESKNKINEHANNHPNNSLINFAKHFLKYFNVYVNLDKKSLSKFINELSENSVYIS
jgi:DNA-directed RNA polymerase subunit F